MRFFKIAVACVLTMIAQTGFARACAVLPSVEQTERSFRAMIEEADFVFVGSVVKILRRRWNDDDVRPNLGRRAQVTVERARAGEDVGRDKYLLNVAEFAEATAFLSVVSELYYTGLKSRRSLAILEDVIPVNLLAPYTVAGTGPCHSFPRTCPWDLEHQDKVAVAVQHNRFGANYVLYCRKLDQGSLREVYQLETRNREVTKFEAIKPFIAPFRSR